MGSITSSPKLPKAQAPVIITMPASAAPTQTTTTPTTTTTTTDTANDPAVIAKNREDNLLSRGRGVLGTVLTSLRGVLADTTAKTSARKTLLGE